MRRAMAEDAPSASSSWMRPPVDYEDDAGRGRAMRGAI
jgi:hypothetical protein